MERALAAGPLERREVLPAVGQRIERIPLTVEPDRVARIARAALEERLVDGAGLAAAGL